MNIVTTTINDLSEVDFDDLYERSRDAIDVNWPADSPLTDEERKAKIIEIITSGINNEWPGLNAHSPNDEYFMAKSVDTDTNKVMALVCGYIIDGDTHDGRHSLAAADENGSRNWLYSEQTRASQNQYQRDNGITKLLFRNIPTDSVMHKIIKRRANAGDYEVIEETLGFGEGFTNIKVLLNL
jgi:hypothetical protein